MKNAKILLYSVLAVGLLFTQVHAEDIATFSITSDQTSYKVGDSIPITLAVNAGAYSSNLNVIDMTIKFDTAKVEVSSTTAPFTPGAIYSSAPIQSVEGDAVNVVAMVNAGSPAANRSGTIGTINFKAKAEGNAVFTYSDIKAAAGKAGEALTDDYITTTASSLSVTIGAVSTNNTTADTSSSGSSAASVRTATPAKTVKAATTGPEHVVLIVLISGLAIMLFSRLYRKARA